jgi:hypothetical protein
MDWQAAIERQKAALRRIVATLIVMVGAVADDDAETLAAERPTLARHRHRALLRLVRPAEAAARRLVIALALAAPTPGAAQAGRADPDARNPAEPGGYPAEPGGYPAEPGAPFAAPRGAKVAVTAAETGATDTRGATASAARAGVPDPASAARLPPRRRAHQPRHPRPSSAILRNGVGTGIVLPAAFRGPAALAPGAGVLPAWAAGAFDAPPPRILRLPLTDPEVRHRVRRRVSRSQPRISVGVFERPRPPLRVPPTPQDRLDATRLVLRIRALAKALDDLPGEARRFRRWQVRHAERVARDRAAQAAANARAAAAAADEARLAAVGIRIVHVANLGLAGVVPPPPPAPLRYRRLSPLRAGRPPGGRRRPTHEIHEVLAETHWLARQALQRSDTS